MSTARFLFEDDAPIPLVSDQAISGCDKGRASIASGWDNTLRVGAGPALDTIWYAFDGSTMPYQIASGSGIQTTTPCVSAAANNQFVAVWLEFDPVAQTSTLKCARLEPNVIPSVYTLLTGLDVPSPVGNSPVQYGAAEPVIPASVACMDNGSFALSYSHGVKRFVGLYNSSSTPGQIRQMHVDSGHAEYNHCVVATGSSMTDTSARIAFVAVSEPYNQDRAVYVRTYKPYYANAPRFGRPYALPMDAYPSDKLALGPAFAHPAAFRPDGKLVVTWSRQDMTGLAPGTVLGFSVMDMAGTFCPTDLNCNGVYDDWEAFYALLQSNDPFADWDGDGQWTVIDYGMFQQHGYYQGCQ